MKRRSVTHATPAARRAAEALFAPQPPAAPRYWMHETSGVLRPAVEAYLAGGPLSDGQSATLRAYFRQWIMAPAWDRNPHLGREDAAWLAELRQQVDGLTSRAAIDNWLDAAVAGGLDPL